MTLEEILRALPKNSCQKYETTDDCHRVIEVLRFDNGGVYAYRVLLDDKFIRSVSDVNPEEVLKTIKNNCSENWIGFDYKIYKDRSELKAENAQLKKALKNACIFIEGKITCSDCPFDMNCNKDACIFIEEKITCLDCPFDMNCNKDTSRGDCIEILYKHFLKKADKELKEND